MVARTRLNVTFMRTLPFLLAVNSRREDRLKIEVVQQLVWIFLSRQNAEYKST